MFQGLLARASRRLVLRRAAVGLAMFIVLAWAGGADAQRLKVSSAVIPLSGFVGAVELVGWLHVVVAVPPNPILPATIHANLPAMDVIATDTALGRNYLAHGAGNGPLACNILQPVDPCNGLIAGFTLQQLPTLNDEVPGGGSCTPTDPCKAIAFNLNLNVFINGDGSLDAGLSSASVATCGVDACGPL